VSDEVDLSPHPLVTALGQRLGAPDSELAKAAKKFDEVDGAPLRTPATTTKRGTDEAQKLAAALADDPGVSELVTFAGYLGGVAATDAADKKWRLFYFDSKLRTWLLVDDGSILLRAVIPDDKSPFEERDVIWVKSEAPVSQGSGPLPRGEVEARFLRGQFMSAGNFRDESTGGTLSAATGVFCDATSINCCRRATR